MVNRLRDILPKIISPNQFAFLHGRGLLDAVLLANEVVGRLKHQDLFAIKVDVPKAYDSIYWDYLLRMMEVMGFSSCWCCWVRVCLESASFQVLINGEPDAPFQASNGVRQGDPLAPYLFLIGMEGLSCMIKRKIADGLITPARASPSTYVSHILYADDILPVAKANSEEASVVKNLLEDFAILSGLRMNPNKSHMIVGRASKQVSLSYCLGIEPIDLPSSYLGLPLFTGRLTKNLCAPLLNKVRRRLEGWKASILSFAGRVE